MYRKHLSNGPYRSLDDLMKSGVNFGVNLQEEGGTPVGHPHRRLLSTFILPNPLP